MQIVSVLKNLLGAPTLPAVLLSLIVATSATAEITDFSSWTLVEDPPNAQLTFTRSATMITLSALDGAIPSGTDIGFQTVNGATPAQSTQGNFFSPDSDFTIAIDYDWAFGNDASGFLGLGFGIGEDVDGMNSAGVAMITSDGSAFMRFGGAARVADQDQLPIVLDPSTLSGSMFVEYEASSGDVTVGASPVMGAAAPTTFGTFLGIQNNWGGTDLLASFFVRSDGPTPGSGWSGGTADAVFSNFRVLNGTATSVPEPSTWVMLALTSLVLLTTSRVKRKRRVLGK